MLRQMCDSSAILVIDFEPVLIVRIGDAAGLESKQVGGEGKTARVALVHALIDDAHSAVELQLVGH